jgi:hypothetical protein
MGAMRWRGACIRGSRNGGAVDGGTHPQPTGCSPPNHGVQATPSSVRFRSRFWAHLRPSVRPHNFILTYTSLREQLMSNFFRVVKGGSEESDVLWGWRRTTSAIDDGLCQRPEIP